MAEFTSYCSGRAADRGRSLVGGMGFAEHRLLCLAIPIASLLDTPNLEHRYLTIDSLLQR
jgi:hypothetical protein